MIETVINLRGHELWPKRKMRFDDVVAQTRVVMTALESGGALSVPSANDERERLANELAMAVASQGISFWRSQLASCASRPGLGAAGPGPGWALAAACS